MPFILILSPATVGVNEKGKGTALTADLLFVAKKDLQIGMP